MYYEIKAVKGSKEFQSKYGPMVSWDIDLVDPEGGSDINVQLNQKIDTADPFAGQQLHGYIETTEYGLKFKKTQPEDGGHQSSPQRSSSAPSSASAPRQDNPDRDLLIIRQSSLKAAVDVCIANKGEDGVVSPSDVMKLAQEFTAWVQTGKLPSKDVSPDEIPF